MERVRLTIFDDQGELLARRYYRIFWDGQPGHEPLKFSESSITYQDDKEQKDHAITMPPTRLSGFGQGFPYNFGPHTNGLITDIREALMQWKRSLIRI